MGPAPVEIMRLVIRRQTKGISTPLMELSRRETLLSIRGREPTQGKKKGMGKTQNTRAHRNASSG